MLIGRLLGAAVEFKVEVTDRIVDTLPERLQPAIRAFEGGVLSLLDVGISACSHEKRQDAEKGKIQKIELD
jgi:hypothetical protein